MWTERCTDLLVVEAGLQDHQLVAVDDADEAVLLGDPSRPCAVEDVPELFGLADSGEGISRSGSMSRLVRLIIARSGDCQWV